MQGNTDSVTSDGEKYKVSALEKATGYVLDFIKTAAKSVPLVQNIVEFLDGAVGTIYEAVKDYRLEKRVNIINLIIMEHNGEDEVNTTVAFTALDIAFKLRAGNTFDFDEKKSESIWTKIKNKLDEQIEKLKEMALGKSINTLL